MRKTYRLEANEIDRAFLNELKDSFKDRSIEIVVSEKPKVLYDAAAIDLDDPSLDPSDIYIDDGSVTSFIASGKKALIGTNGEKPVGKIIQITTKETPDKRWQELFDNEERESEAESMREQSKLSTMTSIVTESIAEQDLQAGV